MDFFLYIKRQVVCYTMPQSRFTVTLIFSTAELRLCTVCSSKVFPKLSRSSVLGQNSPALRQRALEWCLWAIGIPAQFSLVLCTSWHILLATEKSKCKLFRSFWLCREYICIIFCGLTCFMRHHIATIVSFCTLYFFWTSGLAGNVRKKSLKWEGVLFSCSGTL